MLLKFFLKKSVALMPIICVIMYFIFGNRDYLVLLIGLTVSSIVNIIIKFILGYIDYDYFLRPNKIKKQNPNFLDLLINVGMPSGHAQMAWVFTTYLILLYHKRHHNVLITIILLLFSIFISISRIGVNKALGNKVHTLPQVGVGSLVGIIIGIIFYFKKDNYLKV